MTDDMQIPAKLVGRRLEGGTESWTPEAQAAIRGMKDAAADLGLLKERPRPDTRPELNPYVYQVTKGCSDRYNDDPIFAAMVETVIGIAKERREHEGKTFDDYDTAGARAIASLALYMHDELQAALRRVAEQALEEKVSEELEPNA